MNFMSSEHWLTTEDLTRHYRRGTHTVRAVDGVSIAVERGEFASIVGASGSGKSTLLNLLAGLDTPTSGQITVNNTKLSSLSRHELAFYRAHTVGMVFQSFNLIGHHTALRNVELALYFTNTPRSERKHRAQEMLDRVGLADRIDHRPADLSGGEQQRVALARALVKQPAMILADEPTGNLDQQNTDQIARLLQELNEDHGLTVVMVTHDSDLARRFSHRTIRMHYGQLVEQENQETSGDTP